MFSFQANSKVTFVFQFSRLLLLFESYDNDNDNDNEKKETGAATSKCDHLLR